MFAWQGWQLDLPDEWNPVKLEGDASRGQVLIADLHHPRLGLRWTTPGRRFEVSEWARQALVDEVGQLAAAEAKPAESAHWSGAMLYCEPDLPGRDVWVAQSTTSGRNIQIVCHVDDERPRCIESIVASLKDAPPDAAWPWAVFDLSCRTPAGWRLADMRLNAGDLLLVFRLGWDWLAIRQLALADFALKRMSLEKWLTEHQRRYDRMYRVRAPEAFEMSGMTGVRRIVHRRRRFWWARHKPAQIESWAVHDSSRNRLVLIDSSLDLHQQLFDSLGFADPVPQEVNGGR